MSRRAALTLLALAASPAAGTPAAAQQGAPLRFEAPVPAPLEGAAPYGNALAGGRYLLPLTVRNASPRPLVLRRIALSPEAGLTVEPPDADGVDNDRDGQVDEGDEGFDRAEAGTLSWRGDAEAVELAPGEAMERAAVIRIDPDAPVGADLVLRLLAAASDGDEPLREEAAVPFALRDPVLGAALDAETYRATDEAVLTLDLSVPSGRLDGAALVAKGSPAVRGIQPGLVELSEGLACTVPPVAKVAERTMTVRLEGCRAQARAGSMLRVTAALSLRDANAFADPREIEARRGLRVGAVLSRDGAPLGEAAVAAARLTGPLLGARLVEGPRRPVDAGDEVAASYLVVNRGDAPGVGLRLLAEDDGALDCGAVTLDGAGLREDACAEGLVLPGGLAAGESREVEVVALLRSDARLTAPAALSFSLVGQDGARAAMPPLTYPLRRPAPPRLSLEQPSGWRPVDGLVRARVGDVANVAVQGGLPEGRFPFDVMLLARLVDAGTGEPEGPAPLRLSRFAFDRAPRLKGLAEPVSAVADGWTVMTLPVDEVIVEGGDGLAGRRFRAEASVVLRDLPPVRAGRLVELTAALRLYGDPTFASEDWIEALVIEPQLDLTLRSPDEDRTLELDAATEVAALACNRGTAAAESLLLSVAVPPGLAVIAPDEAWLRLVPAEASGSDAAVLGAEEALGEVAFDGESGILRGVLPEGRPLVPGECAALAFGVRRAGIADTAEAAIRAAVEPYRGGLAPGSRIYPAIQGPALRFRLPPVRFGPVSERDVGTDPIIGHEARLELPGGTGRFRVDLSVESTGGLDWTILRVGEDGAREPWRDGTALSAGEAVDLRFEAPRPPSLPLGWVDTSVARALVLPERGSAVGVSTRLVSRRGGAEDGALVVTKTLALDRDCDGDVSDERQQDALFEPVKDAAIGDCVLFRVAFRHEGGRAMEQIVVRDRVPPGTEMREEAVEILRAPEMLANVAIDPPGAPGGDMVWRFEGLFEPGTEGEVAYAVRVVGEPR